MASPSHLDDEDDFGGDYSGNQHVSKKRSFGDLDDDEDDFFGLNKDKSKEEETAPGVTNGMIVSLRESLRSCKDTLTTCETELEAAKSEIQKWYSAFQNEPGTVTGTSPEPALVVRYLHTLNSSEESLKEQLEKAKKKEAAFIVAFAKREQEISELKSVVRDLRAQLKPPSMQARKLLLDPAIHEEFTRLKNLIEEKEKKVKELQDNVAAVNFTPQSKMGKMLMAKCRTLQEENDEIGTLASEGKIHELGMKLALQKSQNASLRNQFEGLHEYMEGLTNEVEKSNETVLSLKQKLEQRESEIKTLREALREKELKANTKDDSDVEMSDLKSVEPFNEI